MAATAKHLKQLEAILLGIRKAGDEKLAQLNSEFLDQQEWLRKAVVDTKESKCVRHQSRSLVCLLQQLATAQTWGPFPMLTRPAGPGPVRLCARGQW